MGKRKENLEDERRIEQRHDGRIEMNSWSTLSSGCSRTSRTDPGAFPSPALASAPHLPLLNATDDVTAHASEVHVNARIANIDLANQYTESNLDGSIDHTDTTQHNITQHSSLCLAHEADGECGRVTPTVRNGSRSDPRSPTHTRTHSCSRLPFSRSRVPHTIERDKHPFHLFLMLLSNVKLR